VIDSEQELTGFGESTITLVFPPFQPFSPSTPASPAGFAPHDPVRARAFAADFPTIEAIVEELEPSDAGPVSPHTRGDLDLVRVGCWGNVIAISDFALVDDGNMSPVLDVTTVLAERYPEARIVGDASIDRGENHAETCIHLPGGLKLDYEGWPAGNRSYFKGDPHAMAQAVGVTREDLAKRYIDLDDPESVPWGHFGAVLLEPFHPWGYDSLAMSEFRVRHTEQATDHMEEIWLQS
jgi:hypothetical protein